MLAIKKKYRSKFELKPDLHLKLTLIKPEIKELCKYKQAQCSHKKLLTPLNFHFD